MSRAKQNDEILTLLAEDFTGGALSCQVRNLFILWCHNRKKLKQHEEAMYRKSKGQSLLRSLLTPKSTNTYVMSE